MNIAEQLKTLLPDVEITEEFVGKLTASIEAAVAQRVDEETAEIKQKAEEYGEECRTEINEIREKADAYAEYVVEEMTQKVDDYAEYVVEQFVAENEQRLVETEEYNRMATALRTIREAFEANYFALSNEPASDKISKELSETKSAYNDLFEQHRTLKHQVDEYDKYVEGENRKAVFEQLTADLADTQVEKLSQIVEKTSFTSVEAFEAGVKLMVEELVAAEKQSSLDADNTPPLVTEQKEVDGKDDNVVDIKERQDKMKKYLEKL